MAFLLPATCYHSSENNVKDSCENNIKTNDIIKTDITVLALNLIQEKFIFQGLFGDPLGYWACPYLILVIFLHQRILRPEKVTL